MGSTESGITFFYHCVEGAHRPTRILSKENGWMRTFDENPWDITTDMSKKMLVGGGTSASKSIELEKDHWKHSAGLPTCHLPSLHV